MPAPVGGQEATEQRADRGHGGHRRAPEAEGQWPVIAPEHGVDGGQRGGEIICTGTPEEVAKCSKSYTGEFLKKVL